jgi:hypothetical protein
MWEGQLEKIAVEAGAEGTTLLLENASEIGRRWLDTIPYFQHIRLSDANVSAGLRYRTLARHHRTVCKCGKPAGVLHEEVCSLVNHVERHNSVRDDILAALRRLPSTEVIREPSTDDGLRRNDIGLRGPGRFGRRNLDYDLKVYSPSQANTRATLHRWIEGQDVLSQMRERCSKWFSAVEKRTTDNAPASRVEFRPLVLTTGGMMSANTAKEFESWEKEIGKIEAIRLQEAISVSLLASRTRLLAGCLLQADRD